jgi:pyridoxal-phosphate dependent enzyme
MRPVPPAGVVAASGGNHGAAVAFAANKLGVPARIFVPVVSSAANSPFHLDLYRLQPRRLTGDGLSYSYAGHNARQAFHKCLFHGVSHHSFVLTAEERPKPVGSHDALPCHMGRDLGRNRGSTEAPGELGVANCKLGISVMSPFLGT